MPDRYKGVEIVLKRLLEEMETRYKWGFNIRHMSFQVRDLVRVRDDDLPKEEVGKKTIYHVLKMLERAGYLELIGKRWYLSRRIIELFDL